MTNPTAKLFLFTVETFVFSGEEKEKFIKKVVNAVEKDDGTFASAEICHLVIEAACLGLTQVVNLFLTVNKNLVDAVDSSGETALIGASFYEHEEVVACLLAAGANVNKANKYGSTPLWWAARNGNEGVVKKLLAAKADVNQADKHGQTPLWSAARNGHEVVVKQLLAAKAEVTQNVIADAKTDAIKKLLVDAKAQKQDVQECKTLCQEHDFVTAVRKDGVVLVFKPEDVIAMACDEKTALERAFDDLSIV